MFAAIKTNLVSEFASRSVVPAVRAGSKVVLIPAGNDTKPHPANDRNTEGTSVFRDDSKS